MAEGQITVELAKSQSTLHKQDADETGAKTFATIPHDVGDVGLRSQVRHLVRKGRCKWERIRATWTWLDYLTYWLPCVEWLRTYRPSWVIDDFVAGISVGFMVVPQGDITSYNNPKGDVQIACQEQYNRAAIQLAFLVACLYTGIGVLQLGWITKFLSHPVIGGFTSGAAITIGLGQVKYILGFNIVTPEVRLNYYLSQYIGRMKNLVWQEYIMGMTLVGVMVFFKEGHRLWKPLRHIRSFGPIACCIIGLAAQAIGDLGNKNIKLVGTIPSGLPGFTGSWWTPMNDPTAADLMPIAIVVMFVDLLESTSIARAMARKNGYELKYTREIIGLGLANFAGAMSNAYTTTGSFSRTAVNNNAGAKSPLAQFVCAWVVGFVLLFLTTVFSKLPMNVLGAIICVSVASLFEWEQAIYLWKVNKLDLLCWLASFFGVLFYSVEVGLALAVGLAVVLAIYNSAFPHIVVLGQIRDSVFHRNVKQFPGARITPGLLEFRVDAPLYYANVTEAQDKLEALVKKYDAWSEQQGAGRLRYIVWDLTPVLYADSMGLHFMEDVVLWARKRNTGLLLANPCKKLVRDWEPIKFLCLVGPSNVYVNTHEAVEFARRQLIEQGVDVTPRPWDFHTEPPSDSASEPDHQGTHYAKDSSPVKDGAKASKSS